MRIIVLGAGYVGLVSGVCFALQGHTVDFVDPDPRKLLLLRSGRCPMLEPTLEDHLQQLLAAERVTFHAHLRDAPAHAECYLIAVGTAVISQADATEDLRPVEAAITEVVRQLTAPATIVIKSTVPIGFTQRVLSQIHTMDTAAFCSVAMNPEFLREGSAVADFLAPDRIVIGTDDLLARDQLRALYAPWTARGVPLLETTPEGAETIKHAANAFLATKIAFINEIAALCEQTGAPLADVARGVGLDHRIGPDFLRAGPGFGGSCLPKDLKSLIAHTHQVGQPGGLLDAVWESNQGQLRRSVDKIRAGVGGTLRGKRIAMLGLAFKAGTNDLRASPAMAIVEALVREGATVQVYDPVIDLPQLALPEQVVACASPYTTCAEADLVCIATEWPEYGALDWPRIAGSLRTPWLVDLRNCVSVAVAHAAGLNYWGVGTALQRAAAPAAPHPLDCPVGDWAQPIG